MTSDEKIGELSTKTCCKNNEKDEISSLSEDAPLPSANEVFLHEHRAISSTNFNFKSGFALESFEKIVQYDDLHHARENTRKRRRCFNQESTI